jgi:GntR family transcriptional regulator
MGEYLSHALDIDLHYGLLDELYENVEEAIQHYDLIITTFHHLSEVTHELGASLEKVVGIDTRLTPETMLRIARLPNSRIGVVSTLQNTTHMLKHILHSYYPERSIQAATVTEPEAVANIGRTCDHILVTHTCAEEVEKIVGRNADVIINFQIDEQSIQFLSRRIHEIQAPKTVALHLKS